MQTILIRNVEHLASLASDERGAHIFIHLNGGIRSSKFIRFHGKRFYIFNEIDGSEQRLSPNDLSDAGLLLEAIATGNCFAEQLI